jgi:hypothetical protein
LGAGGELAHLADGDGLLSAARNLLLVYVLESLTIASKRNHRLNIFMRIFARVRPSMPNTKPLPRWGICNYAPKPLIFGYQLNDRSILLRKVFHILLAILVFISSSGLMFSKHYCQGELKNTALFVEAASCHSLAKRKFCPHHNSSTQKETTEVTVNNSCCATVTDFVKNEDHQLSYGIESPVTDILPFLPVMPSGLYTAAPMVNFKAAYYLHYKPPLLVCDFPVCLQTFLC